MTADRRSIGREEAELESLYQALSAGVALLSPDLRIVRCNDAFASPPGAAHRGRALHDVLPTLASRLATLCHRVLREGTPIINAPIDGGTGRRASRRLGARLVSCTRVVDQSGAVLGVTLVIQEPGRASQVSVEPDDDTLRMASEGYGDLMCRFLPNTTLTFVNDAYCHFFGKTREELIGHRFLDLVPASDRASTLQHLQALVTGGHARFNEHSVLMPDGSIGRQQWINRALVLPDGRVEELEGIGRDITDKWRAEESVRVKEASLREAYQRISSLAQRLIMAQEAERSEIARNLHDDIGQQLAALTIGLSVMEARVSSRPDFASDVAGLRHMINGLADKVRSTSHMLHPGILKHAGLSEALASHCETIAAQHDFSVTFDPHGGFEDVSDDVALCLYRVVQQALRNVVMHAEASSATVTLTRTNGVIELVITDDGRGFDPSKAHVRGIGLLSIEERVRFANGTFAVDSAPGGGSQLRIEIPVGVGVQGRGRD